MDNKTRILKQNLLEKKRQIKEITMNAVMSLIGVKLSTHKVLDLNEPSQNKVMKFYSYKLFK